MPELRSPLRGGGVPFGGVTVYPLDRLYEELAFIAYHFHWPYGEIMEMDHQERQRWVEEIASINTRLNEMAGETP